MYIATNLDTYNDKYLSGAAQAAVDGMHDALEDIRNTRDDEIEMEDRVADKFNEADEECNITNEDMKRIWDAAIDAAEERIESLITMSVVSAVDADEQFEERKKCIEERYKKIALTPDFKLYDTEGYLYRTVKSVSGDKVIVALDDPMENEEKEREMTADEVKSFCLGFPQPLSTSYLNGTKKEHYQYGGDKVTRS